MEPLYVEPTEDSPKVILDHQKEIFEISGESRPENTSLFYTPILNWIEQFEKLLYWEKTKLEQKRKICFEFKFVYFNSTSAKYIMDILVSLDKMRRENYRVSIKWYFKNSEEDIKDSGEEFAISLPDMNIELVSY